MPQRRSKAVHVSLAGALLLAAGVMFGAGCVKDKDPPPTARPAPEVTVAKPVSREVTDYFEFPGQTAAVGHVEVRARVMGYLKKVNFVDGQAVKKGDLLFEIDPEPYQAVLDRAEGDLDRLHALLHKAEVDLARTKKLLPSGAASQDEYEQRVAQLAVFNASLKSSEAAVREAKLDVGFTKITSPIDGRVSRTRVTEGNLIQVGSGDDTVLTTVVTTNPIYVYFDIDEHALLKYIGAAWGSGRAIQPDRIKQLNIPVRIGLENEEGFPHTGVLDFVDNRLDQETGTIRARGVFDNSKQYLTPGLFVRVRIPFGKPHEALMVSEQAIGRDQSRKFLLAVNKDNVVEYRQVKVGALREGMREIESGIQPDDRIIVKGLQRVRAGVTVKPEFEEEAVAAAGGGAGSPAPKAAGVGSPAPNGKPSPAQVGTSERSGAARGTN